MTFSVFSVFTFSIYVASSHYPTILVYSVSSCYVFTVFFYSHRYAFSIFSALNYNCTISVSSYLNFKFPVCPSYVFCVSTWRYSASQCYIFSVIFFPSFSVSLFQISSVFLCCICNSCHIFHYCLTISVCDSHQVFPIFSIFKLNPLSDIVSLSNSFYVVGDPNLSILLPVHSIIGVP